MALLSQERIYIYCIGYKKTSVTKNAMLKPQTKSVPPSPLPPFQITEDEKSVPLNVFFIRNKMWKLKKSYLVAIVSRLIAIVFHSTIVPHHPSDHSFQRKLSSDAVSRKLEYLFAMKPVQFGAMQRFN